MFAFGDVDSTSGHRMAYCELQQAGDKPEVDLKSRHTGSRLATATMVANEEICPGDEDKTVFDSLPGEGHLEHAKVRVFYISTLSVDYVRPARRGAPRPSKKTLVRRFYCTEEGEGRCCAEDFPRKQVIGGK